MKWPMNKRCYELAGKQVSDTIDAISKMRSEKYDLPKWNITTRLKANKSILLKLSRKRAKDAKYSISNITDLVGVRVIVESINSARRLKEFIVGRRLFKVEADDVEDFLDTPRSDGYRGTHIIVRVSTPLGRGVLVPVELQIRTILQHQWAELSHCEFYKAAEEIPPSLMIRMSILSNILHCADVESEQLLLSKILDDALGRIWHLFRVELCERLAGGTVSEAEKIGRLEIALIEYHKQVRRALISTGVEQVMALDAMNALKKAFSKDAVMSKEIKVTDRKVRGFLKSISA